MPLEKDLLYCLLQSVLSLQLSLGNKGRKWIPLLDEGLDKKKRKKKYKMEAMDQLSIEQKFCISFFSCLLIYFVTESCILAENLKAYLHRGKFY